MKKSLSFPQISPKKSIFGKKFNRESGQSTPKTKGRLTANTVNLPIKVVKNHKNGAGEGNNLRDISRYDC